MVNSKANFNEETTMGIPVKFYSVTPEEYDRIRQQLEQGVDGSEEAAQRKRDLEGGIFFVEEHDGNHANGEIHKVD